MFRVHYVLLIISVHQTHSAVQSKRSLNTIEIPTRHTVSELHNKVAIPVPQPILISIPRAVPYPVHVGVPVEQPRPVPVAVPQPVAHVVPRPIAVPVDRPFPYPIAQPVPITITQGVEIPVPQPYVVGVPSPVPVRIPQPVPIALDSGIGGIASESLLSPHDIGALGMQPILSSPALSTGLGIGGNFLEAHGHAIQHSH